MEGIINSFVNDQCLSLGSKIEIRIADLARNADFLKDLLV
jgi:hypothetical protein